MRSEKRGRLSAIDLLPEEAWPHVSEALKALADRKRTAESIRTELNEHLLAIGCNPISSSSFNRKSLQLSRIGSDISKAREMAAVFAEKLDEMPEGDVGMLINEMVKVIIYNMTADMAAGDLDTSAKLMKEISLTLYRLEQAGGINAKRRREIEDRAKSKATEAVQKIAKERGISNETAQAIVDKVLGRAEG
jgi:hypothetical protein